jgi:glycosyltransferase involved in cell wall biosynthesis
MFTSWGVPCGIASYAQRLIGALEEIEDTHVSVVPYDRQKHPPRDYVRWGQQMNAADIAHIQHEYSFFGYLVPWQNRYPRLVAEIRRPLVVTRHVTFDGPLLLPGRGLDSRIRRAKWSLYNRWFGPYARYLNKDMFDVADQIIVLSGRLKEHLVRRGVRPDKIHIVPGGVPVVSPPTGGSVLRAEWGWSDKQIIGLFGYITPVKGHRLALDMISQLPDEYALLIAGGLRRREDRLTLQEIEKQIDRLDLRARVRITGYLDEAQIPAHVDACQVLLYPYTHADFSTSVVSGLAYKSVPVIASDIYSHREIAGYCAGMTLFRSGDLDDLERAILQVTRAPAFQEAARQGMAMFAREVSWHMVAKRTKEIYEEAIQAARQVR